MASRPTTAVHNSPKRSVSFFDSINPLELLRASKTLTPREFLRDFYTQRGLRDKLSDVDALVAMYGHQMQALYVELDRKYGTDFSTNPPPVTEEVRSSEPVAAVPTTPKASAKPPVNKIVLLGNSGVGKTNLLSRLHKGEFSSEFASTIGVEFLTHTMRIGNTDVKAQIWDTAGQERFHAMMTTYYRKAVGALLIFDVGDRASLQGVEKWLDQLLNVAEPGLQAVLVGNKCDLEGDKRKVSFDEAQQFATARHMPYIETSAKTGLNVEEAFHGLIETIHRSQMPPPEPALVTVELSSTGGANKSADSSFFRCDFV